MNECAWHALVSQLTKLDRQNGRVMLDCILCAGSGSSCADMPWLMPWFSLFSCQVGTLTTVLF